MRLLLLLLTLAALVLFMVRWQTDRYAEFLQDSSRITAEVVKAREVVIEQKNRRKEWQVEYAYSAHGQRYTNSEKMEYADLRERFMPGQVVEVYVSNTNPARSFLAVPLDRRMNIGEKITKVTP